MGESVDGENVDVIAPGARGIPQHGHRQVDRDAGPQHRVGHVQLAVLCVSGDRGYEEKQNDGDDDFH